MQLDRPKIPFLYFPVPSCPLIPLGFQVLFVIANVNIRYDLPLLVATPTSLNLFLMSPYELRVMGSKTMDVSKLCRCRPPLITPSLSPLQTVFNPYVLIGPVLCKSRGDMPRSVPTNPPTFFSFLRVVTPSSPYAGRTYLGRNS